MILLIFKFLLKASVLDNAILSQCHDDAKTYFLLLALFLAKYWTYRKMKQNAVPYFLLLFIDCKDQCPFCEAKGPRTKQGALRLKWNTNVHYLFEYSQLLLRILRPIKFYLLSHPIYWRAIYWLSSHLLLGIPSGSFPRGFPPEPSMILFSPPHVQLVPSVTHWFDHMDNIWRGVQILKLHIVDSNTLPCHFVPLRPRYVYIP